MTKSKTKLSGWILSGLLFVFLAVLSAMGKFISWDGKDEMLAKMGFTSDLMIKIGILEVIIAILFMIPRTAFIGAILLSAYLGGATLTHLRVGEPIFMPILIGILVWVALGLRDSRIFSIAFGNSTSA